MSDIADPRVAAAAQILARYAESFDKPQELADVSRFVDAVLISERKLLPCYDEGIVTAEEVVSALIDRFCTRTFDLSDPAGQNLETWAIAARELHAALFVRTLLDVVAALGALDSDSTIYAVEPWTYESAVAVARQPDDGSMPDGPQAIGAAYFLEISIALEVLEHWREPFGPPPTDRAKCERLISYAINDA